MSLLLGNLLFNDMQIMGGSMVTLSFCLSSGNMLPGNSNFPSNDYSTFTAFNLLEMPYSEQE